MIGQTISQYTILEKLGEGGMGVVYKAEDAKLKRIVALKFLPAHLAKSDQDKARFIHEAQAASALNHPNVCTIHDIQEYDGQMFIVMEFVDGKTLREKQAQISFKQALEIGVQIAEGLAAAHEKGIVHRDIKPENIMIRKDGIVQIMDFGLAKLRSSGSKITRLTREGSTIGTAGYMSPEQVQGQDTDHRSDIFSYGVLMYELIAGEPPFKGVHETALMYEIVNVDPAPLSAIKPELDPALDAIILECLEKDPNERTQSVKQVAIDLKRLKRETTRVRTTRTISTRQYATSASPAQPASSSQTSAGGLRRYLWPVLAGIIVVLALTAGLYWWMGSRTAPASPLFLTVDLRPNTPNVSFGNTGLEISADGSTIAYLGGWQNSTQIYLRHLNDFGITPIQGTTGAIDLGLSPDGESVAFTADDKLKIVPVHGGSPQIICSTKGLTRGLCWAPDGYIYYGHINEGIHRVRVTGGEPEVVTKPDSAQHEISHRFPQLLPGGKSIIYTVKLNNISKFSDALIAIQTIGSDEKKIVVHGGTFGRYLAPGYLAYIRGDEIYAAPFDAGSGALTGQAISIMPGGWLIEGSGQGELSIAQNGTVVYAPSGTAVFSTIAISWLNEQGKMRRMFDSLRAYGWADLSPDGQKVALDVGGANDDIWVYQLQRGIMSRLTFGGGNNNLPIWSPDGQFIVYQSEKGKVPNLYRKRWDGSTPEERLTESPSPQVAESFTPDGKFLTFTQDGDIWVLPMQGDRKPYPFLTTPAHDAVARISPDGHWMAFSSDESGKPEAYVVPFPHKEGKWQVSAGGGLVIGWSRDGKRLFFVSGTSVMAVDVNMSTTFDYSAPRVICSMPSNAYGPFDISLDGKEFLVGTTEKETFSLDHVNVIVRWDQVVAERLKTAGK